MQFPYGPQIAVLKTRDGKRFQAFLWGRAVDYDSSKRGEHFRYLALSSQPRGGFKTREEAVNAAYLASQTDELLEADYRRAQLDTCTGWTINDNRFVESVTYPLRVTAKAEPESEVERPRFGATLPKETARKILALVLETERKNTKRGDGYYDSKKSIARQRRAYHTAPDVEGVCKCGVKEHRVAIKKGRFL